MTSVGSAEVFDSNIAAHPLVAVGGYVADNSPWVATEPSLTYNGDFLDVNDADPSMLNVWGWMHVIIDRSTGDVVLQPVDPDSETSDAYPVSIQDSPADLLASIEQYYDQRYLHIVLSRRDAQLGNRGGGQYTLSDALISKLVDMGATREALELYRSDGNTGDMSRDGLFDLYTFGYVLVGIPGIKGGNGLEATQEQFTLPQDALNPVPVVSTILLKNTSSGIAPHRLYMPIGMNGSALTQDDGDLWAARGIEAGNGSSTEDNGGIAVGHTAIAGGTYAAAFGKNVLAGPEMTLVGGNNVRLEAGYADAGAVAFGQFNLAGTSGQGDERKPIFVVGSGSSDERKDAFVIYDDGSYQLGQSDNASIESLDSSVSNLQDLLGVTNNNIINLDGALVVDSGLDRPLEISKGSQKLEFYFNDGSDGDPRNSLIFHNGSFEIYDQTANKRRLWIAPDGSVSVPEAFAASSVKSPMWSTDQVGKIVPFVIRGTARIGFKTQLFSLYSNVDR